ncbi:MAG: threonine--tRNA ligase [Lachnospiraceae bacterium]|jgi:threonyl-tRNA synthetase|nr:threonine--tRNA ligase [Lachnospiraceae bacterium]
MLPNSPENELLSAELSAELSADNSTEFSASVPDRERLATLRHTASHILAEAVKTLFPTAKLAIGPAIENGFYYDFDHPPFSHEDLTAIEAQMKKIIKANNRLERFTLSRDEAVTLMVNSGEPYKVELISDLPADAEISFYRQGDFTDLCAGPHLERTGAVKAYKLLSSSAAYWRGDSANTTLQRIYGTAFFTKPELEDYLAYREKVRLRDHNRIGREMELFTTVDIIGQGLPLFMPKGTRILQTLQRWIEDEEDWQRGYVRTKTPFMGKSDLYKLSGHWEHYRDGMFVIGDADKDADIMALRPMTCPFQYFIYKASQKSYRDLPIRYGETAVLFRNEDSGEMHGLTRVRQFTISEGHLVVRPDQMEQEFRDCIDFARYCMQTLGVDEEVTYRLSKCDPADMDKYIGDPAVWEETEARIRAILVELGIPFVEAVGEAAFYGPKVDLQTRNVYGKEDTVITIQWDAVLAERYDMYYIDQNGDKVRPYMIHRTALGCYERTLAWLIEFYEGKFPTWLCPEQVRVLPISDKFMDYAESIRMKLHAAGIYVSTDTRSEKLGYKIRDARIAKIPYLLVVGAQEEADGTVSVRSRFAGDEGVKPLSDFIDQVSLEIRDKIRREELRLDEKS